MLWNEKPGVLLQELQRHGLRRAYMVTRSSDGKLVGSHPMFDDVIAELEKDSRDFDRHEGCFFEVGLESDHLMTAFVHRTTRGQAAGGVRYWVYDTFEDLVRDGLRLARGMGHKNALAGLWWGGGKGVIDRRDGVDHRDPDVRAAVYRDYGRFATGLGGCYVTAEDVGTHPQDMAWVFRTTRFTSCIPREFGGSGNPSILTATGVVIAMEAALAHLGNGDLAGKVVAMQGAGNVADFMIQELLDRNVAKVVASDINESVIDARREAYSNTPVEFRHVDSLDTSFFSEPCDVFAPNAVGACLNARTIPIIKAPIICGAANNQLEDPERDAPLIKQCGKLYVPDFLCNRMGIVNCSNEQYGVIENDPAIAKHLDRDNPEGVYRRCLDVLERAQSSGATPAEEAVSMAEQLSREPHPLWPGRGRAIIDRLVAGGWAEGPREP